MTPLKWCSGHCGRELPRESFQAMSNGYVQSMCKGCRRVYERERQRRVYRRNREWAERKRANVRAAYWARKAAA